jgi:hypothetical protein
LNSAGASLPRSGPPIAYSNLYVQALQQDGATQMPPLALIGGYVPTNPPPIALRKVGTKKLPKLGNLGRPPRGLPKLVNLGRPLGPKKFPTRPTWTSFGLLEITHSLCVAATGTRVYRVYWPGRFHQMPSGSPSCTLRFRHRCFLYLVITASLGAVAGAFSPPQPPSNMLRRSSGSP